MLHTVINGKWREHMLESAPFIGAIFMFAFLGMVMLGVLGVTVILSP
jgi:hypothetical protein